MCSNPSSANRPKVNRFFLRCLKCLDRALIIYTLCPFLQSVKHVIRSYTQDPLFSQRFKVLNLFRFWHFVIDTFKMFGLVFPHQSIVLLLLPVHCDVVMQWWWFHRLHTEALLTYFETIKQIIPFVVEYMYEYPYLKYSSYYDNYHRIF